MSDNYIFESERLGFREWTENDSDFFAQMNSNEQVMKYMLKPLNREESDDSLKRIMNHFDNHGYGLYAVELKSTNGLIGFIGFQIATFYAHFTPCIEIGWRLDSQYWNQGYGTEGARRVFEYGVSNLNFRKMYSFTSLLNEPSIHIMEKIGLQRIEEFDHPKIPDKNPLKKHVLYGAINHNYRK